MVSEGEPRFNLQFPYGECAELGRSGRSVARGAVLDAAHFEG